MDGTVDKTIGLGDPLASPISVSPASAAAPAPQSGGAAAAKPAYPPPAPVPTQHGPKWVRFDFNEGCRVVVDPAEMPPRNALADETRPLAEPYVCIAAQSTTQSKCWNNPLGWHEIVGFLKEAGYRIVCIDQQPVHGAGIVWSHIPHGVEDETGGWLRHAEFFIGLSSGLSWLAWAVGTPVVMISGFTHPTNEFTTPYRAINYHACNSCWNDPRHRCDHRDFLWCPRHANTPCQFECTRLITAEQVKQVVRKIPGFGVIGSLHDHMTTISAAPPSRSSAARARRSPAVPARI